MNIKICSAAFKDTDRISDILIESRKLFIPYAPIVHSESDIRRWVERILLPSGGVTVALREDLVVAVIAVSNCDGINWIDQMYVAPEYVNNGIGTSLLLNSFKTMTKPVRLYTFQENTGARRLYEKHGFIAIQFTNGENNEEQCPDVLYELPA